MLANHLFSYKLYKKILTNPNCKWLEVMGENSFEICAYYYKVEKNVIEFSK